MAAPFATPVYGGRSMRPKPPRTDLWALLYAQVTQLDGASRRNVLLMRQQVLWRDPFENRDHIHGQELLDFGVATLDHAAISEYLRALGQPLDSGLSVLVVELIGQPFAPTEGRPRLDPLGRFLGDMRVLRTSTLTPVADICAIDMG